MSISKVFSILIAICLSSVGAFASGGSAGVGGGGGGGITMEDIRSKYSGEDDCLALFHAKNAGVISFEIKQNVNPDLLDIAKNCGIIQ